MLKQCGQIKAALESPAGWGGLATMQALTSFVRISLFDIFANSIE